ncbi:hypothetical protein [Actinoplanes sp. NPDC020271]|uniref:hypothetical protein n=1 Tax=Actinoplanes sp. NPDC020271 TaxID=3363896 RepID=UPI003798ABBC
MADQVTEIETGRIGVATLVQEAQSYQQPASLLLSVAGLLPETAVENPFGDLPAELQELIVVVAKADARQRETLLQQVRFLNQWAALAASVSAARS